MARLLSQTLITKSRPFIQSSVPSFRLLSHRPSSSKPDNSFPLIELDVSDPTEAADVKKRMARLEDAIHMITVMRSAPDWLPFVPGSSYWVPPAEKEAAAAASASAACAFQVVELVKRFREREREPISEEEALSLTTVRGWPSTAFFVEGKEGFPSASVEENQEKKQKSIKTDEEIDVT